MRWPHLFYPACHCAPPQCQVAKIRIDIHVCIHQPSDSATRIHIHVTHTSRYTRRHPYARKDVTISYRTGLDRIQGSYPHQHGATMNTSIIMIVTIGFLPTRPQGARRRFSVSATTPTASFYPRARGGRDKSYGECLARVVSVSIHAPAGARRRRGMPSPARGRGFYPRARGGGRDRRPRPRGCACGGFYPRARGGRDSSILRD